MENYGKVLKYTEESANAAGTAEEKYSAYTDSLQAHINNLISTWQEFVNNMNMSGTFNSAIDILSQLVNVLDLLLNKFGLLKLAIPASIFVAILNPVSKLVNNFATLGSRLSQFNTILNQTTTAITKDSESAKALGESISGLTIKQQIAILSRSNLNEEQKEAILVNAGLTSAEAKTALSTTAIGNASAMATAKVSLLKNSFNGLKLAFLSNPIGLIITGITTAVSLGTIAWQSYNQEIQNTIDKGKELSEAFENFTSENSSAINSLESMREEFERLSDGVSDYGENISLSTEDYQRYKDIVAEILGYSPELISGYDKEGKAIANKNGLLEKSIELMKQEQELKLKSFISEDIPDIGIGKIEELYQKGKEINSTGDTIRETLDNLSNAGYVAKIDKIFKEISGKTYLQLKQMQAIYGQDYISKYISAFYERALDEQYGFSKESLEEIRKYIENRNILFSSYSEIQESMTPYLELIPQIADGYESLTEQEKDFVSSYISTFKLLGIENEKTFDEWTNDIINFTESLSNADPKIRTKIQRMFALDSDDFSAEEYKDKIYKYIDSISKDINISEEQKLDLMVKFGITVVDEKGNEIDRASQMKETILEKFEGLTEEDLESLSYVELELLVNTEGVDDLVGSELPEFLENLKREAQETSEEINTMTGILSSLAEEFDGISGKYETLKTAVEEFNTYGAISADTLKSISDNDLIQYLQFTENGLIANTDALWDSAEASRAKAAEDIKTTLYEQLMAIAMDTTAESADGAATGIENAGNASETASKKFANGVGSVTSYATALYLAADASGVSLSAWSGKGKQIKAVVDQYNSAMELLNKTTYEFTRTTGGSTDALKEHQEALENEKEAIESLIEAFIKMFKQQLEDQKKVYEDAKDLEDERYENVKKNLEEEERIKEEYYEDEIDRLEDLKDSDEKYYEDRIEALENELDAYQEKIDKQKELLEAKKEEQEYEKELEEKVKSVAKIESELAALQFDDSIEAQKKKIELMEELAEKQGDLDEFQSDHEYDLQQDALDKELERFEELQNAKIEAIENEKELASEYYEQRIKELEDERELWQRAFEERERFEEEYHDNYIKDMDAQIKAIEDAIDNEKQLRLDALNAIDTKNEKLYQKLLDWNFAYGTGVSEDITSAWNTAQSALEKYKGVCEDTQGVLEYLAGQLDDIEEKSSGLSGGMNEFGKKTEYAKDKVLELKKEIQNLNKETEKLSGGYSFVYGGSSSGEMIRYHTGTDYVQSSDEDRKISKAMGLKSDEVVRVLKVGEAVIPKNENLQRLKDNNGNIMSQNIINRTKELSSTSQSYSTNNNSSVAISIGDTIIQGNADQNIISELNKYKKSIVNEVFSKINKHTSLSGFRNARNYV